MFTNSHARTSRRLTRRRLIALGGGAAALVLVGCDETMVSPPLPASSTPTGGGQGNAGKAVLRFTIGVHIEPIGATAQGVANAGQRDDYHSAAFFDRHVQDLQAVASMVRAHGGRLTIQAQSPFTSVAIERRNRVLEELAADGHEVALHFHEDAHLGTNPETLPVDRWCEVLSEEIALVKQASGVERIRYWSGGNLYPNLYEAAVCAGLEVNSDWKNPDLQKTPLAITGIHPWRPAGGTDGHDFTAFSQHDPNGPVVFLPEGLYDKENFHSARRTEDTAAYFAYLAERLQASADAAVADRVNVFHFTIHPGEFRGEPGRPFGVIEEFLTNTVDPLVAAGRVEWATISEMADAFIAWERANPGVAPK